MALFYERTQAATFAQLLALFPDKELPNLTRSTVPLVSYWQNYTRVATTLFTRFFGGDPDPAADVHFEYQVPSLGRNRPSQTDVVCLGRQSAFGVEGKSTEPRYATVADWLNEGDNPANRKNVLNHWLGLIEARTGAVNRQLVPSLVNQMVHRMASVCSLPAKQIAMVYQVLAVGNHGVDYAADLEMMAQAVNARGHVGIWLHVIPVERTPAFQEAAMALEGALNEADKASLVKQAILDDQIFVFGEETFTQVC